MMTPLFTLPLNYLHAIFCTFTIISLVFLSFTYLLTYKMHLHNFIVPFFIPNILLFYSLLRNDSNTFLFNQRPTVLLSNFSFANAHCSYFHNNIQTYVVLQLKRFFLPDVLLYTHTHMFIFIYIHPNTMLSVRVFLYLFFTKSLFTVQIMNFFYNFYT